MSTLKKRNSFLVLSLALLVILMTTLPATAGEPVNLNVNGDPVKAPLFQENGVSFITAKAFVRFAGADLTRVNDQELKIIENDTTLSLAAGKKEALLNGQPVTLPAAPVKQENEVFIPLRFVADTFGFEVGWDGEKQMVSLNRNETRDGLTATDLLAKSNQAVMNVNTYSMAGNLDMTINMAAAGQPTGTAPVKMTTRLEGQIQNNPMQLYMIMTMTPDGMDVQPQTMETYMTEDKIYVKAPGQEWTVQDNPLPAEFWKQQQDIQNNPLKAVAQMKEMGMLFNFGNDAVVDGREYYVINTTMDMNKFRQAYEKLTGQVMQNIPLSAESPEPAELQAMMQKLMEKMSMDYYCTAYINKETLINDIIKLDMTMNMTVNPAELAPQGSTPQENMPGEITTNVTMQGDIKITDLGQPFAAPDVSNAVAATTPAPTQAD